MGVGICTSILLVYVYGTKLHKYCIMQVVHGGKLSRLQHLVEIRGKTFAVLLFMQYIID